MERAHRLKLLFDKEDNGPIVASFKPFAKEAGLFSTNVKGADDAAAGKEVKPSPEDEKTELKHKVAKDLSAVCLTTKSYAMTYKNPTLAVAMNVPETDIFHLKDEDILPFFTAQNKLIAPLFWDENYADYEITPEVMSGIGETAAQFHNLIGQTGVNQSDYTVANTEVDGWLTAIALNVEHFDLLIVNLEGKYPQFAEAYRENARLGVGDVRHSGIEGVIAKKGTGAPVANAVVHFENTQKTAVSGLPGDYRLVEVRAGWYNLLVLVDGVEVVRVLHKVEQGKVEKMDFEV